MGGWLVACMDGSREGKREAWLHAWMHGYITNIAKSVHIRRETIGTACELNKARTMRVFEIFYHRNIKLSDLKCNDMMTGRDEKFT